MQHPAATQMSRNPQEVARTHFIRRLLELNITGYISDAKQLLLDVADITDEFVFAIGADVADNVKVSVDMKCFTGAVRGALEGDAAYEAQTAVEEDSRPTRTLYRGRV